MAAENAPPVSHSVRGGDSWRLGLPYHGNQPNMQSAWLLNFSGKPWLTQKWTRESMSRYYGLGPVNGYPGDEGQGQMGAWYVMSAMGLFEMAGGCVKPIFDKVTIHWDNEYCPGGRFVIQAKYNSPKNVYIQSASLNGTSLNKPWLYHSELVEGGTLTLQMGPEPNRQWGSAADAAPPQQAY